MLSRCFFLRVEEEEESCIIIYNVIERVSIVEGEKVERVTSC